MKPILFNTEMVRAILEGRKTVTRRVVAQGKSNPLYHGRDKFYGVVDHLNEDYKNWYAGFYNDSDIFYGANGSRHIDAIYFKAPCKVGDVLYVRETWCKWYCYDCGQCDGDGSCDYGKPIYDTEREEWFCYCYKANGDADPFDNEHWRPSIHMPKEAARIFLKVTDVRVERLQDITEEQAIAEGIRGYTKDEKLYKYAVSIDWWEAFHYKYRKLFKRNWWQDMPRTAREAFHYLWHSTLGRKDTPEYYAYNWNANPYVWVIEFERVTGSSTGGIYE